MSWRAEIDEIHRRRELAGACGGPEAVAKHHAAGKLTVRERIDALLDKRTFRKVGKLAGRATYDKEGQLKSFEPAPYVMGLGKIDGRAVAVGGEDYTIRAGTGFGSDRRKGGQGGFVEDLACQHECGESDAGRDRGAWYRLRFQYNRRRIACSLSNRPVVRLGRRSWGSICRAKSTSRLFRRSSPHYTSMKSFFFVTRT